MNELSLHILDICQNSIKANATLIEIDVIDDTSSNTYTIIIKDNGSGMDGKTLSQVADPFYTTRTTRKVGLGISLFKMAAEQANGTFDIHSEVDNGTTIKAVFENNHIDRAPLGDIEETLVILLLNEANIDILYKHTYNGKTYILDSREIKKVLDGIPFTNYDVMLWIKNNIIEGISEIQEEETK